MKAILVIEMPSKCRDCQFYYQTHDENDDYVSKCEVLNDMTIDGFIDKYSGCPLRPAPEKRQTLDNFWEMCANIVRNACIDEILGGSESE